MRVIQVSPTPFGAAGILGGGERYPLELARALAPMVDCELLTFGRFGGIRKDETGLLIRTLPARHCLYGHPAHPLAPALVLAVRQADVVHAHQMRSAPAKLAALACRLWRRSTAVTDHGMYGGDWRGLLQRSFDAFLFVSAFSARVARAPASPTRLIYGGADPRRFAPRPREEREGLRFVGRVTPHKGIDVLIRALRPASACWWPAPRATTPARRSPAIRTISTGWPRARTSTFSARWPTANSPASTGRPRPSCYPRSSERATAAPSPSPNCSGSSSWRRWPAPRPSFAAASAACRKSS
ncbi:MAG: glycosyltransferase [Dehalococcoidales bacterium]|nr:glycosyltransferase [Dehalococcoidales bacterium]